MNMSHASIVQPDMYKAEIKYKSTQKHKKKKEW